jgi:hypothetical protein
MWNKSDLRTRVLCISISFQESHNNDGHFRNFNNINLKPMTKLPYNCKEILL